MCGAVSASACVEAKKSLNLQDFPVLGLRGHFFCHFTNTDLENSKRGIRKQSTSINQISLWLLTSLASILATRTKGCKAAPVGLLLQIRVTAERWESLGVCQR